MAKNQTGQISQANLKSRVQSWVLHYLHSTLAGLPITPQTGLAKLFKDNNATLTNLAGAFAWEVQNVHSNYFAGLIDPRKLSIPADKYLGVISDPDATVAQIIDYLYQRAKAAAPTAVAAK